MDSSPGVWLYLLANGVLLVSCGLLLALSLLAYRQSDRQRSYAFAAAGFLSILLGGASELAITLLFEPGFSMTSREYILLQVGEDTLIAIGLVLVFCAIRYHDTGSGRGPGPSVVGDDDAWIRTQADDR